MSGKRGSGSLGSSEEESAPCVVNSDFFQGVEKVVGSDGARKVRDREWVGDKARGIPKQRGCAGKWDDFSLDGSTVLTSSAKGVARKLSFSVNSDGYNSPESSHSVGVSLPKKTRSCSPSNATHGKSRKAGLKTTGLERGQGTDHLVSVRSKRKNVFGVGGGQVMQRESPQEGKKSDMFVRRDVTGRPGGFCSARGVLEKEGSKRRHCVAVPEFASLKRSMPSKGYPVIEGIADSSSESSATGEELANIWRAPSKNTVSRESASRAAMVRKKGTAGGNNGLVSRQSNSLLRQRKASLSAADGLLPKGRTEKAIDLVSSPGNSVAGKGGALSGMIDLLSSGEGSSSTSLKKQVFSKKGDCINLCSSSDSSSSLSRIVQDLPSKERNSSGFRGGRLLRRPELAKGTFVDASTATLTVGSFENESFVGRTHGLKEGLEDEPRRIGSLLDDNKARRAAVENSRDRNIFGPERRCLLRPWEKAQKVPPVSRVIKRRFTVGGTNRTKADRAFPAGGVGDRLLKKKKEKIRKVFLKSIPGRLGTVRGSGAPPVRASQDLGGGEKNRGVKRTQKLVALHKEGASDDDTDFSPPIPTFIRIGEICGGVGNSRRGGGSRGGAGSGGGGSPRGGGGGVGERSSRSGGGETSREGGGGGRGGSSSSGGGGGGGGAISSSGGEGESRAGGGGGDGDGGGESSPSGGEGGSRGRGGEGGGSSPSGGEGVLSGGGGGGGSSSSGGGGGNSSIGGGGRGGDRGGGSSGGGSSGGGSSGGGSSEEGNSKGGGSGGGASEDGGTDSRHMSVDESLNPQTVLGPRMMYHVLGKVRGTTENVFDPGLLVHKTLYDPEGTGSLLDGCSLSDLSDLVTEIRGSNGELFGWSKEKTKNFMDRFVFSMRVKANIDSIHSSSADLLVLLDFMKAKKCVMRCNLSRMVFSKSSRWTVKLNSAGVNPLHNGRKLLHLPLHKFPNISLMDCVQENTSWKISLNLFYFGRNRINFAAFTRTEEHVVLMIMNTVIRFYDVIVERSSIKDEFNHDDLRAFSRRVKGMRYFEKMVRMSGYQTVELGREHMRIFAYCFEFVFQASASQSRYSALFGKWNGVPQKLNNAQILGLSANDADISRDPNLSVGSLFTMAADMYQNSVFVACVVGVKETYLQEMKMLVPGIEEKITFEYISANMETEEFSGYVKKGEMNGKVKECMENAYMSVENILDMSQLEKSTITTSFDVGVDFDPATPGCCVGISRPDFVEQTRGTNLDMDRFRRHLSLILTDEDMGAISDGIANMGLGAEEGAVSGEWESGERGMNQREALAPTLASLANMTSRLYFSEYLVGDTMRYCDRHSGKIRTILSRVRLGGSDALQRIVVRGEDGEIDPLAVDVVRNALVLRFSRGTEEEAALLGLQTYHPTIRTWQHPMKLEELKLLDKLLENIMYLFKEPKLDGCQELATRKEEVRRGVGLLLGMQENLRRRMVDDTKVALRVELFVGDGYFVRRFSSGEGSNEEDPRVENSDGSVGGLGSNSVEEEVSEERMASDEEESMLPSDGASSTVPISAARRIRGGGVEEVLNKRMGSMDGLTSSTKNGSLLPVSRIATRSSFLVDNEEVRTRRSSRAAVNYAESSVEGCSKVGSSISWEGEESVSLGSSSSRRSSFVDNLEGRNVLGILEESISEERMESSSSDLISWENGAVPPVPIIASRRAAVSYAESTVEGCSEAGRSNSLEGEESVSLGGPPSSEWPMEDESQGGLAEEESRLLASSMEEDTNRSQGSGGGVSGDGSTEEQERAFLLDWDWIVLLHVCFSKSDKLLLPDLVEGMDESLFRPEVGKVTSNMRMIRSVFDSKIMDTNHNLDFEESEKISLIVTVEKMMLDAGLIDLRQSWFWNNVFGVTPAAKAMSFPLGEVLDSQHLNRLEHNVNFGLKGRFFNNQKSPIGNGVHPYDEFLKMMFAKECTSHELFGDHVDHSNAVGIVENNERLSFSPLWEYLRKRGANPAEFNYYKKRILCARMSVVVETHIRVLFWVFDCFGWWRQEMHILHNDESSSESDFERQWDDFPEIEIEQDEESDRFRSNVWDFVWNMLERPSSVPIAPPGPFSTLSLDYFHYLEYTETMHLMNLCIRLIIANYSYEMFYLKVASQKTVSHGVRDSFAWVDFPVNEEMLDRLGGDLLSSGLKDQFFVSSVNQKELSTLGTQGLTNPATVYKLIFGVHEYDQQRRTYINNSDVYKRSGYVLNMGKLRGWFESIGEKMRLHYDDLPPYCYSFDNFRESFVLEYLRECSGLRSFDSERVCSKVLLYVTNFTRRSKLYRPPVRLDWVSILTCMGSDRYDLRREEVVRAEREVEGRELFRASKASLKASMGVDVFVKVWPQRSWFRKSLLFKSMFNHLLPLHCMAKCFSNNREMNRRFLEIAFHNGITMLDFYPNMDAAVEGVENARKQKTGNVFSIITCDEDVSNHQTVFKLGIVKRFAKFMTENFSDEGVSFADKIARVRNEFWDKTIRGRVLTELVQSDQLVDGVTSFDMFKCTEGKQVEMDGFLVEDGIQFQKAVRLLRNEYVLTRRFVEVAYAFYEETIQVYKDLEEWKLSNAENPGYLKEQENLRLNVLSTRYGVERTDYSFY